MPWSDEVWLARTHPPTGRAESIFVEEAQDVSPSELFAVDISDFTVDQGLDVVEPVGSSGGHPASMSCTV